MATEDVVSTYISNRDASPRVPNDLRKAGRNFQKRETCAVSASGSADANSTYRFFSLPSNAVIVSAKVTCPSGMTTSTMHLGLYRTIKDGGAVVDVDFFKASVAINGALTKSEVTFGNVITVAKSTQRLWELRGETTDQQIDYDVVGTLALGNAGSAGTVLVEIDYKLV